MKNVIHFKGEQHYYLGVVHQRKENDHSQLATLKATFANTQVYIDFPHFKLRQLAIEEEEKTGLILIYKHA